MDQRAGRARDDLTPATQPQLDPVDPTPKTAVAAGMEGRPAVLICCPLAVEYWCLWGVLNKIARREKVRWRRTAESLREDAFVSGDRRWRLAQTGLGANSARCVANLIVDHDPEFVCLIGFAGALDPSLVVGDTVEGGVVWSAESGELVVPVSLGIAARMAQMLTVKKIVESPETKAVLFGLHHCAAAEMEAFDVGKVCEAHRRLFVTARAISDAADEPFPNELLGIIRPSGNLSTGRLALAVARKPTLVRPLYRLWKNSRRAKQGLRDVVRRLVKALS